MMLLKILLLESILSQSDAKLFGNIFRAGSTTSASATKAKKKCLTLDTISPNLKNMEYAVRGDVVTTATKINQELEEDHNYDFDKIIFTNIGNPHSMGQKPLTWPRQVLALVDLPSEVGIDHPDALKIFPSDAIERAREIKSLLGHSGTGAYSHSKGALCFRKDVAAFLRERDGIEANAEDIFLTNGASNGIGLIMTALISDEKCGIMVPIPQYPFYSASITLLGGQMVGYYLDESKGWDLNMEELEKSLKKAEEEGLTVKGLVLINPGNPTGQVLTEKAVQDICQFCSKHNIVLLADEVYQENIYQDGAAFVSCKRASYDLGLLESDSIELVSFHSTSKGLFGECGRRGGYMELVGIDPQAQDEIYKLASASLCSSLSGQVMTSLMVRGPKPGDVSYESYEAEKSNIYQSLKRRARLVSQTLNSIEGFSCQEAQGAMYCFPQIHMPKNVLNEAKEKGVSPDTVYALDLLKQKGICVVPASGFGQKDGRIGVRTTFLASEDDMEYVVTAIKDHYLEFCNRYA